MQSTYPISHGYDADAGHGGEPCNCTDGTQWNECTQCQKPCDEYHEPVTTENQPISTKLVVEPKTLENEGEEPDTLCIEIKASEITIGEQLNIGDMVRMTVTGTVEEIRNSRYWDRIEEEEMSKRKYMIRGYVVNASITEGHVISVTDPEDDGGEI